MSLTDENKQLLVRLHLEKSHACLADGESLLTIGSVSAAANRFYYAVFHAIHALFVVEGLYSKSHHGTNAQFHQHFIKTGLLDSKFGQFVAIMENLREKADYDIVYHITRDELETLKPLTYEFVQQVEQLLKQ